MLGCAFLALAPPAVLSRQIQLTASVIARALHTVTWDDFRISVVCAESNPAARVCSRPRVP
jgi:hypothetical protein